MNDVITYLSQFVTPERIKLIDEKIKNRTRYISLLLENIYQSHNASAILRTADCFGVQDIYVVEKNNKFSANDEIALGANQWLNIQIYKNHAENLLHAIEELKKKDYRIVATSLNEKSMPLEEFDFTKGKVVFLFGTELTGLSDEAHKISDEFVHIPMRGFTQSLNVSVAAGIIMHFATWRLQQLNLPWKLSTTEQTELKIQWLKKSIRGGDLIEQYFINQIQQTNPK